MTTPELGINDVNFKFFENNRATLIQLSITERKQNGFGLTLIDMSNTEANPNNVDVKYFPIEHPLLDPKLKKDVIDKASESPESVLYFCMKLKGDNLLFGVDLQKEN